MWTFLYLTREKTVWGMGRPTKWSKSLKKLTCIGRNKFFPLAPKLEVSVFHLE